MSGREISPRESRLAKFHFTPANSYTNALLLYVHRKAAVGEKLDDARSYPSRSPPSMNPPHGLTDGITIKRGMDARLYDDAVKGLVEVIHRYRDSLGSQLTATGNTVLHLHVGISAYKAGMANIRFIQTALDHQESFLLQKNDNGEIPLHLAARFGHDDAVKFFISRATAMGVGCLREMLRTTDRKQDTALHLAVRSHEPDIVELLLNADRDCPYSRNVDGQTPLYLAAERKYPNVVASILKACESPAYGGPLGRTALHVAVLHEDEGMVNKILEKNKAFVRSQDDGGQTPLHYAAGSKGRRKGPFQCLEILLQYDAPSHDSAVYIRDNDGRTALHLAVLYGDVHRVKALIEHRPDCSEIKDNEGRNLLHFAAKSKCRPTIDYLLRNGIFNKLLNEQDQEGNTPLHLLVTHDTFSWRFYVQYLRPFRKNRYIDSKVFNSQNLTAGDILHSQYPFRSTPIPRSIYRLAPRDVPTPSREQPDESQHARYDLENNKKTFMSHQKKSSEVHLVVATLIATVSFAAGSAVPGGFNQDPVADRGTALLTRQTAFRAFMVSDAFSLALSAAAILLHFRIVEIETARIVRIYYTISVAATSLSIGTMMVAFMAGTYATVYQSPSLAAMILTFPALFMFFYATYLLFKVTHFYRSVTSAFSEQH